MTVLAKVALIAVPAVVATRWVADAIHGPDVLDPDIPPPCWVPHRLHDRHSFAKPDTDVKLRVRITNHGATSQAYGVETNDPAVSIMPASIVLGPLEHGEIVLTLAIPGSAPHGHRAPVVVTVKGCESYRLRWLVKIGHAHPMNHAHHMHHVAPCCSAHVDVHERPDYEHHWYDHFYCERPCGHP